MVATTLYGVSLGKIQADRLNSEVPNREKTNNSVAEEMDGVVDDR